MTKTDLIFSFIVILLLLMIVAKYSHHLRKWAYMIHNPFHRENAINISDGALVELTYIFIVTVSIGQQFQFAICMPHFKG